MLHRECLHTFERWGSAALLRKPMVYSNALRTLLPASNHLAYAWASSLGGEVHNNAPHTCCCLIATIHRSRTPGPSPWVARRAQCC